MSGGRPTPASGPDPSGRPVAAASQFLQFALPYHQAQARQFRDLQEPAIELQLVFKKAVEVGPLSRILLAASGIGTGRSKVQRGRRGDRGSRVVYDDMLVMGQSERRNLLCLGEAAAFGDIRLHDRDAALRNQ